MRLNLRAMHVHILTGGQPEGCTCPRALCGGAEQGPNIRTDCKAPAHGTITMTSHHAFECAQLPADTDMSRLWLVTTKWTANGPVLDRAARFDRSLLASLRASNTLWDVSEGDTPEEAAHAWQAHMDAMRAEAAHRQAQQVAEAKERARLRHEALAALKSSANRSARSMIAHHPDGL